ncbi:hypothetical protein GCM10009710_19780 [Aeromicrobium alkaliterrae]|uniref:Uncharacterized protein n=1 Tax=Aeromicrobium alkaliterrae TaxID=302168 RepID=A0ABN2JUN3_9ACTN
MRIHPSQHLPSLQGGTGSQIGAAGPYAPQRHISVVALPRSGAPEPKDAEEVAARRAKGKTVGAIAADLNLSVATVRRTSEALTLAQEIEVGDHDAKYTRARMKS